MGDRRMAEIKTSEGSLFIYVHHHGYKLPEMARNAVEHAKVRLGDEPYFVRIVVDQLIKDGRDQELSFGIMLTPRCEDEYNNDKPSVIIYAKTGKVKVIGGDGT